MIRLHRLPIPDTLQKPSIRQERQKIIDFYTGNYLSYQTRYKYNVRLLAPIKNILIKQSSGKCNYCESKITITDYGNIDQFRPKSIYPWLIYDWDNLMYCCTICDRYKSNRFPILNQIDKATFPSVVQLNQLENPLLIDPYTENPEQHFSYYFDDANNRVTIIPHTDKGSVSIETLALNRDELCFQRYQELQSFKTNLEFYHLSPTNIITGRIHQMLSSENAYSGMIRQFFSQWIVSRPDREKIEGDFNIYRNVSLSKKENYEVPSKLLVNKNDQLHIDRILMKKIKIVNFKSIDELELEVYSQKLDVVNLSDEELKAISLEEKERWTLILGENGVGKSSILQAISLALLDEDYRRRYPIQPNIYLKNGKDKGYIEIELRHISDKIRVTFDKYSWNSNLASHKEFLLAYGSIRLFPLNNIQPEMGSSQIKVQNLFNYSTALIDGKSWLLLISESEFNKVAILLKKFLNFLGNYRLARDETTVFWLKNNSRFELDGLSEGYKSVIALVLDIYMTLSTQIIDKRYDYVQDVAEGVILIDEIGTHLHPQWKMKIVSQLRNAFPKINFVVTSHDPLCLTGLENGEVVVLRRDNKGKVYSLSNLPDPAGMRADQLLTSEYFGLESTVNDPQINAAFKRYYQLLAKQKLSKKEFKERDDLYVIIKKHTHLGENLREEIFYFIIDKQISVRQNEDDKIDRDEIKQSVLSEIQRYINNKLL